MNSLQKEVIESLPGDYLDLAEFSTEIKKFAEESAKLSKDFGEFISEFENRPKLRTYQGTLTT